MILDLSLCIKLYSFNCINAFLQFIFCPGFQFLQFFYQRDCSLKFRIGLFNSLREISVHWDMRLTLILAVFETEHAVSKITSFTINFFVFTMHHTESIKDAVSRVFLLLYFFQNFNQLVVWLSACFNRRASYQRSVALKRTSDEFI